MITYKAIIEYFDVISQRHMQIQSFTYGEINLFDKDKFTMYPALHLTPTGTAIDDQTITYGFDVVVFDRYDVTQNKMRNEATCLSDALLILQDICKEMTNGKYFINEDTLISMEVPVIAQPFIDTEPDNCSGWTTSFNVITPNEVSRCNIPYYLSETQHGLDFTLPDAIRLDGSDSRELLWFSRERFHAKSTITSNEVAELFPLLDTYTSGGSDRIALNGTGVTWDAIKNGIKFKDISSSSVCNLQHLAVSVDSFVAFIRIKDFGRYSDDEAVNCIAYFGEDTEQQIEIRTTSDGKLSLYSWEDDTTITSDFAICPDNGTNSSTQHRRLESYTFAVEYDGTDLKLYYDLQLINFAEIENTLLSTDNMDFGIGARVDTKKSDFYLEEFLFTPTTMSSSDIKKTMQWINYR